MVGALRAEVVRLSATDGECDRGRTRGAGTNVEEEEEKEEGVRAYLELTTGNGLTVVIHSFLHSFIYSFLHPW